MKKLLTIDFAEITSYIETEFRYEIQEKIFPLNEPNSDYDDLNSFLKQANDILQDKIRKIILLKHLDEVEIYKKADIDRKLFSKIRTLPDYHPNKNTLIKLCLSMQLNIEEAAGYSLSRSIKSDLILRYCFHTKIFDIITVNKILDHYDEKIL
ncbi:MAG: hypothetical protein J5798_05060 [Spirochaetaceae bacterium]|nr:hypothetical protein [Spirochaetaceae bacterium]